MPATGIEHPPFLPGQYMAARQSGATLESHLVGQEFEGKEYWFLDHDYSATGAVKPLRSNIPRKLRIVRNVVGVSLPPKRLVVLGIDGTANDSASTYGASSTYTAIQPTTGPSSLTRVGGIARLPSLNAFPVDEYLPSTGVPHGALFYIVVEGPAMCTNADSATTIASGGWLGGVITATTSASTNGTTVGGRLSTAVVLTTTALPLNAGLFNVLGRALSTTATSVADVLVNVRKVFGS